MHMSMYSYGHSQGVKRPWNLFSVCDLIHDYEVRNLALCNIHEKKFSRILCKTLVLQNIFILTYISALLCAQREKNTA